MSGFDDHSKVVVLEFVVKRLIIQGCLRSNNPKKALSDWLDALKEQEDMTRDFAFSEHARNDEVRLNAISSASEFAQFSEELAEDFERARSEGS